MAVVRARSAPPYGLFAAVALAVLCAGAAILFYVLWSKQSSDYEKALSDRVALETDADRRNIRPLLLQGVAPTDKSTVLELADKRIKALQSDLAKSQQEVDRLTVLQRQDESDLTSARQTADAASKKEVAIQQDAQTTLGAGQQSLGEKDATIKKLQDDLAAANAARDQAIADGEKKLSDALAKAEQDARAGVLKQQADAATLAAQETELNQLRQLVAQWRKNADVAVGEPDGTILNVDAAAGNVWITLTTTDRIQAGMTFSVYDPRTGVRFGSDDQAMGNGSIEVMKVGERSSLCRITRTTKGKAIQTGDLIANLVYHNDKTRQFRFVIVGDFDLDGDGIATAAERDRLISMVKSDGGVVDDTVTSQTDYLIMGKPPASPATVTNADASATAPGGIADERSKQQQAYDQTEQDARRLAIPVLNANRFLAMIGYYNTTVVRY